MSDKPEINWDLGGGWAHKQRECWKSEGNPRGVRMANGDWSLWAVFGKPGHLLKRECEEPVRYPTLTAALEAHEKATSG